MQKYLIIFTITCFAHGVTVTEKNGWDDYYNSCVSELISDVLSDSDHSEMIVKTMKWNTVPLTGFYKYSFTGTLKDNKKTSGYILATGIALKDNTSDLSAVKVSGYNCWLVDREKESLGTTVFQLEVDGKKVKNINGLKRYQNLGRAIW